MSPGKQQSPSRLVHFSPLRYPGGKGKLAQFVKSLITSNAIRDGAYVEPFAGGAAIALELLLQEYVSRIYINDVSRPVYSFWASVLDDTERLCRMIVDTPLTVEAWDQQKKVLAAASNRSRLKLGFATFYLNRTNRSGILNGGIIGGRDQTGPWKIDARYNPRELVFRIESIAKLRDRIHLSGDDAIDFLQANTRTWPSNTLIYLDPPYYVKGRDLYYDYYAHDDHVRVAAYVKTKLKKQKWIVSYDNVPEVLDLYGGVHHIAYNIGYSARKASSGAEVMFFGPGLVVPDLVGPIKAVA